MNNTETDITPQIEKTAITADTASDYDRIINTADLASLFALRCTAVRLYMAQNHIQAAVFEDTEERRDPAVRYLSGHPSDALFIITAEGKTVLIPWDEHLAAIHGHADIIIPYTKFKRRAITAVHKVLASLNTDEDSVVELPPVTPYPLFLKYVTALESWNVKCHEHGVHDFVVEQRAVKDIYEIACTRKACAITSHLTDMIEGKLKKGSIQTESDVALFIEKELRSLGCERTGFDTLAAGPSRSFAIHAFPGYTAATWGGQGLSILDYGVVFNGYTSDATITVARGPLSATQKKIINAVQEAAETCVPLYQAGKTILAAAAKADSLFSKTKRSMPHGLGHGIGLEIHEAPFVSMRADETETFKPGMIITCEPGLYDENAGGCRLENDVLVCDKGNILLTNSRIIAL